MIYQISHRLMMMAKKVAAKEKLSTAVGKLPSETRDALIGSARTKGSDSKTPHL